MSSSCTLMKAAPLAGSVGRRVPAPICALAKAVGKSRSMPITSPVERISGPSSVSTPGNFANGKTASLTATCLGGDVA